LVLANGIIVLCVSNLATKENEMATQTQEISIIKTILASPARVYTAFTTAEGWREWCCEKAESDVSIGGKLHISTEGYNAYGEFKVLEQDRNIAFTWNGDGEPPTLIHISLERRDYSTVVTFTITGLGSEQDWANISKSLERIWGRVLNNLKNVLETKQ
jgi:uncharacterized protein YndB with AHSA1/START domain